MKHQSKGKLPVRVLVISLLFVGVPLVLARVASLAYSSAATDILYMGTVWEELWYSFYKAFSAVSFAAGIAATAAAAYSPERRSVRVTSFVHAALLCADALAAFVMDAASGAARGQMLLKAGVSTLETCLWSCLLVFSVWLFACRCRKGNAPYTRPLLLSAALYMIGRLISKTVSVVSFLAEVNFDPYPNEIVTIVGEYVGIVCLYGVALFLVALLLYKMFLHIFRE